MDSPSSSATRFDVAQTATPLPWTMVRANPSMNRSRLANLLGIAIGVAGLAFVAVRIVQDREAIADAVESSDPVWLVVAVVSGLAAMALLGINWLLIVRHGGAPAPWRRGLYWFFVGQLGKYVPGGHLADRGPGRTGPS